MGKFHNKKSVNDLSKELNKMSNRTKEAMIDLKRTMIGTEALLGFVAKTNLEKEFSFEDLVFTYMILSDIFDSVKYSDFGEKYANYPQKLKNYYTKLYKHFDEEKLALYAELKDTPAAYALSKALVINDERILNEYVKIIEEVLNVDNDLVNRIANTLKLFESFSEVLDDAIATEKSRDIISDELKGDLKESFIACYAEKDMPTIDNLMEVTDFYNNWIKEQRRNRDIILNKKAALNNIIKENPLESGYNKRIEEIDANFNAHNLDNFNLSENNLKTIDSYINAGNLNITKDNIIELDSLLFLNQDQLEDALVALSKNKLNLYLNLLFRTYIVKNMVSSVEYLLSILPNIEMRTFDAINYLNSINRSDSVALINNFKQLIFVLSDNKGLNNDKIKVLNNSLDSLIIATYYFANEVYDEAEYKEELDKYAIILNDYLSSSLDTSAVEHIDDSNDYINGNNFLFFLTDKDNIPFVEKNLRNDYDNIKDIPGAFDKIKKIAHIKLDDKDLHKYKSDSFSEEYLKKLHFKSYAAVRNGMRVYLGRFTNQKRENLLLIYGARSGAMDSNSQNKYGSETLYYQVKPNEDKIKEIIEAFTNDSEKFELLLKENRESIKHLEKYVDEIKKGEVNTLKLD